MKKQRPFARKRFGQHFLTDMTVVNTIIDSADISEKDHIIEIGPGRGVLTESFLKTSVSVTAIEIDRDLSKELEEKYCENKNLRVITEDILVCDWSELIQKNKNNKIVANLPYNISTPLFFKFVEYRRFFHSITIMVQKELADRIVHSGEGKRLKDYGILSVISRNIFNVKRVCDVPSSCFIPQPKVESAVIQLFPLEKDIRNEDKFFKFVRSAFNYRRKLLLTQLKNSEPLIYEKLSGNDLEYLRNLRPENLSPGQYLRLFEEGKIESS
ncbi:ribosomal RNA small subunit methyltransferase A [bacterium]|nr:ribosomal RNA small subunit methyltransferase A [bacterium]